MTQVIVSVILIFLDVLENLLTRLLKILRKSKEALRFWLVRTVVVWRDMVGVGIKAESFACRKNDFGVVIGFIFWVLLAEFEQILFNILQHCVNLCVGCEFVADLAPIA
jgi:hypothetical protein